MLLAGVVQDQTDVAHQKRIAVSFLLDREDEFFRNGSKVDHGPDRSYWSPVLEHRGDDAKDIVIRRLNERLHGSLWRCGHGLIQKNSFGNSLAQAILLERVSHQDDALRV